ncbi:hypothetical protein BHE74_00044951, partial [Ensete ventricosum]
WSLVWRCLTYDTACTWCCPAQAPGPQVASHGRCACRCPLYERVAPLPASGLPTGTLPVGVAFVGKWLLCSLACASLLYKRILT